MKKKIQGCFIFDMIMMLVAGSVLVFLCLTIGMILLEGIPYIGTAFASKEVRFAIRLSIQTATCSTLLSVLLAIPTAYTLVKIKIPCSKVLQGIIELPLSLPYLVLGLSLMLLFSTDFGKWLSLHGIKVVFSKTGIVLAQLTVNLPFVIRIIKTAFLEVDERLEWISRMLGATKAESFFSITLPISKNSIIGAVILAWSRGLGEFGATLMLVGTTRMKTETLPASIYLNIATGDMQAAMSSALLLLFISAVSQFLFSLLNRKKQESRIRL